MTLDPHLDSSSIYRHIVRKSGLVAGLNAEVIGLCPHSTRATAATTAIEKDADLKRVQQMLGHANIATTNLYDRRGTKPEDSATVRIKY
jgi:integrase/recombinase XerD